MTTYIRKGDPPEVGQRWRNRREHWRRIEITSVSRDEETGEVRVFVKRSASRRSTSLSQDTLHKDYEREDW